MRITRLLAACALASRTRASAIASDTPPKSIDIKAPDGTNLKATYYDAGKPGPAIVMLHACNKDRWSWNSLAIAAAARGFHLIALDCRGFGESGGERPTTGPEQQAIVEGKWPGDVDAAFTWVTSQPQVDKTRVAAIGASCGVNQSVQLAKRHREVRTVVLLSGGVNEAARLFLRDTPALPIFAAASRGDSGAVDQMRWMLGWSRNPSTLPRGQGGRPRHRDVRGREGARASDPRLVHDVSSRRSRDAASVAAGKPSPAEEFWTLLTSPGGVAKARQVFDDSRRAGKHDVLISENETNQYGYQLLQSGNAKDAVEVFKLNVDAYPSSANTYDSLSDAYLALGNRDEALRNAEKALEMIPKDAEASDDFKKLVREGAEKKVTELRKKS